MAANFREIPLFSGLNPAALDLLDEQGILTHVGAGQIILREGEEGDRMYALLAGKVRICKDYNQPFEVTLAELGEGDFFGEMCIFENARRSATVEAVTYSNLISWSALVFHQLLERYPRDYGVLVTNIARDMSRRLRKLDEIFAARH